MPHLSIEYSAGVEDEADMPAFLDRMRDAIVAAPGDFPLGGTRVRAHRAEHSVIADSGAHEFMHMIFRIGAGRDLATRQAAAEAVYAAAETYLKPLVSGSFALSFELVVMDGDTSIKRWNTIREHL